jgi:hypothetical protein
MKLEEPDMTCHYCNKEILEKIYYDDWIYDGQNEIHVYYHIKCWQQYLKDLEA